MGLGLHWIRCKGCAHRCCVRCGGVGIERWQPGWPEAVDVCQDCAAGMAVECALERQASEAEAAAQIEATCGGRWVAVVDTVIPAEDLDDMEFARS